MNKLSKIAVELKEKGFSQEVAFRDYIFIPDKDLYARPFEHGEFNEKTDVRVPSTVTFFGELAEYDYKLEHKVVDKYSEKWILTSGDTILSHENIWVVMAEFWMLKKGK